MIETNRSELDRLLSRAEQNLPGLLYPLSAPNGLGLTTTAGDSGLFAMRDYWVRAHPEAGAHYLAMRCWGLAIWQPIYLCVLTAHLDTQVPRLNGVWQSWSDKDGLTHGVWLPSHMPHTGTLDERVVYGVSEIVYFCGLMLRAMSAVLPVNNRVAEATIAECVLAALLLARCRMSIDTVETQFWADRWLNGIGVANGCGLLIYRNARGDPALMLDRTLCCHHFRRWDGDMCASCVKLTREERISRMLDGAM